MTIILAADHAGFVIKEAVKKFLAGKGVEVLDVGAHELTPGDDYPVYMTEAAMHVAKDLSGNTKAIIFGGSGQGEAMVANRFPGVRAAVWYGGGTAVGVSGDASSGKDSGDIISLSRKHNDANVLSIGARFVNEAEAMKAVELWLATPFSGEERHLRRITEIDAIE